MLQTLLEKNSIGKKTLIVTILTFLVLLGSSYTFSASYAVVVDTYSASNDEIIPGEVMYFEVTVPSDSNNPRLTGTYQVADGETIKMEVLKAEGCPSPLNAFDCISIYSAPESDRGSADISLEPGKMYYLEFSNKAFLFPTKTVNIDFQLEVD